jgi:hypothetical protein
MWLRSLWSLLLSVPLLVAAAPVAAPPLATLTIVDGEAVLIREAARFAPAEGVRLLREDIVETGTQGRLLRIEFPDGLIADLGPATRVQIAPKLAGRPPGRFYLLQGWVKVTAPAAVAGPVFNSALFDANVVGQRAVVFMQAQDANVFAEAGEVALVELLDGWPLGNVTLKGEQFLTRAGAPKASVAARPTAAFIQRVPKDFLDTLPSRLERFKTREVEPARLSGIAYDDVSAWIDAEAGLRAGFVPRWKGEARTADFRRGLVGTLRAHPEWDRTLFPEKYLPKKVDTRP